MHFQLSNISHCIILESSPQYLVASLWGASNDASHFKVLVLACVKFINVVGL